MRGKGEGSVHKDEKRGVWVGVIELPPINGKRQRKTIRRKSKTELLKELARLRSDLHRFGNLPGITPTVEQWFRIWLKDVAKEKRPNTVSNYRTVTEAYIIPNIGKVKLDKITAAHLQRVYDSMLALGRSSTYALNAHRIMSTAFKAAVQAEKIAVNPIGKARTPRKSLPKLETLDLAEGLQVLAYLATRDDGARWATALLTGARRGEAIGLEPDRVTDELDLSWQLQRIPWSHGCGEAIEKNDRGMWRYPCGRRGTDCPTRFLQVPSDYEYRHVTGGLYLTRPKSSAGWRIIPLVEPLKTILERYMAAAEPTESGLLFTRNGNPYDPDQDSREWRRVLVGAGIDKNVRLHDVRHTTVELLYAAGVPEHLIMKIVGHSTVTMTRAYRTRTDMDRLRSAMEQFSQQFMPLDDGRSETRAIAG